MAIQSPFWLPGRQGQKPPPQSVTDSPRTALCRAWAHAGHLREPGLEQGVKEMNDAQEVGNRESREWACVHEPIAPGHLDCSARPSWALLAVRWPLSGCLDTPSLERRQLHHVGRGQQDGLESSCKENPGCLGAESLLLMLSLRTWGHPAQEETVLRACHSLKSWLCWAQL